MVLESVSDTVCWLGAFANVEYNDVAKLDILTYSLERSDRALSGGAWYDKALKKQEEVSSDRPGAERLTLRVAGTWKVAHGHA